ncbi:MAG: ATP-binding cassette domain-containing protein [Spirochaetes bacterium]|nr:ATP-binding cassette domain-containing protein [Spirochaetota bacterium]
MIKVKNLVKYYDSKLDPATNNVSFEIEKGEIVGLLGPNGAGKTTIMRMLTGYMTQSSGEIYIDDMNILDDPISIKKLIGYLPEHTPEYTDMTVFEFLNFIGEIRRMKKKDIPDAVDRMIKMTALEKVVYKKINQLSKGFQKRTGLASVLIHDPKILILDEPTAGLDPNQVIEFRKIIRRFAEQKTVILSTHVLSEIEAICERVIIIKNGSIIADDTIQNLIKTYSNDQYVDFEIEADNLIEAEQNLLKIKNAWKLEFVKKEGKNIFRFRALIEKKSDFESELKALLKSKKWILKSFVKKNANLEEIFLKIGQQEEV